MENRQVMKDRGQYWLLLPAGLAFAWLVSKAQWFWNHNPELSFGWVVVMLCGFLFWDASETRPPFDFRWRLLGILPGALGLGWLFFVQLYQAAYGSNAASAQGLAMGVFALVAANLMLAFGWPGLRHYAFAFFFIWLALPLPSAVLNLVISNLQHGIAAANVEILNLAGIPAQKRGSLVQLANCVVGIDEACSGIRSLQSTVMATLFIGYLTLKNNSLRLTLLVGGVCLAIVGNLIRSLYLSITAHNHGVEAIKSVHDQAGWTILVFTVVGVALGSWALGHLEKMLQQLSTQSTEPQPLAPGPDAGS